MNGFIINVFKSESPKYTDKIFHPDNCISYQKDNLICRIEYNPLPGFENDHLFFENDEYLVVLDGVITNNRELMEEHSNSTWKEEFLFLLKEHNDNVQCVLRGTFCGAVFNKKTRHLNAFTNHSGERAIYYYSDENALTVSSNLNYFAKLIHNGLNQRPNIQACREMLITGSTLHGNTLISNVYRVLAGCQIISDGLDLTLNRYHIFKNLPELELTLDECIEETDRRFRKVVDRIFSKNEEYGYHHEADLSGGLDSRLVTWVANDLGYKNVTNICYCHSGKIDNTTSKKIARDLGNNYLFYPMNKGNFLMDADRITRITGGQLFYGTCTGAVRALDRLTNPDVHLCTTGLAGEFHNGYWIEGSEHTTPNYISPSSYYVKNYPLSLPEQYSLDYDNYEQMNLYEFSNLLFISSASARQDKYEVYAPFLDPDFLDFAYRIPLKWRMDHFFTVRWIMKKYPKAAKYTWQLTKKPVDKSYNNSFYLPEYLNNKKDNFARKFNRFCWKFNIPAQMILSNHMNPFQSWYSVNPKLRSFFRNYYSDHKYLIPKELRKEISDLWKTDQCMERALIVNLLSILKYYYD